MEGIAKERMHIEEQKRETDRECVRVRVHVRVCALRL
jgi:hypothetical protein